MKQSGTIFRKTKYSFQLSVLLAIAADLIRQEVEAATLKVSGGQQVTVNLSAGESIVITEQAHNGTVSVQGNKIIYTPNHPNAKVPDAFCYNTVDQSGNVIGDNSCSVEAEGGEGGSGGGGAGLALIAGLFGLSAALGGGLGGSTTQSTANISNPPTPDTNPVSILTSQSPASEPASHGEFKVTLQQPASADVIVNYTVSGSASSGSDFVALSGSVTIPAGDLEAIISITILDDDVVEPTENLILTIDSITTADPTVTIDSVDSAELIIEDEDVPPTITVDSLISSDNTPQLTGTVSDPNATIEVTVNGNTYSANNNGDGTWTLVDNSIAPALSDGTYDVSVSATDLAGNIGNDVTNNELIIDTTAPVVSVASLTTNDNTPALSGNVDDPTATIEVTVNGNTYSANNNGDGTWTLVDNTITPALSDGTYDVSVSASDGVGNSGFDATTDELEIDTTAPIITITSLTTNDTTPALSGTIDDPNATIEITVNGNTYSANNNGDGTWTLADNTITPALANGTYDVVASTSDAVGNVGHDATINELIIDTDGPTVTVDTLLTHDSSPELTGTVDDPTASISVTVNGNSYSANNNGDGTWTLVDNTISPVLAEGVYDVSVTAEDTNNNIGTDGTSNELEIDLTAPQVTVDTLLTNDNTPALSGNVDDPNATVEVTVNSNTYSANNNGDGTWTLADNSISPALSDGTYDVSVSATDLAGNIGNDVTNNELIIDTTAPVVSVAPLTTNDNTPALTGTIDDPTATLEVTVNGNTYSANNNGDGTWTLVDNSISPALSDGTYDVSVSATDLAGNIGNDVTNNELIIDTTAPVVSVTPLTTNDNTPALTGTIDDPTATIEVTVNGNTYSANNNGDGTWTLADNSISPALSDGTYDVSVSATDLAGNIGNDVTNNELIIDTTAPVVSVAPLTTNDNTPALSGNVDDPTATIEVTVNSNTYSANNNGDGTWTLADNSITPALSDGTYDVSVSATDLAGNIGNDVTNNELIIDTTAPVVSVAPLTTNDNTPALTGTIDDPTATIEVTVNSNTYSANNNGDGTWTLADNSISPALSDGTYDVSVSATDLAGNIGNDVTNNELIIDTTAPVVSVASLTTNDNTPALSGNVDDPTATIEVTVNGNTYSANNNGDGTWTLADNVITTALAAGVYDISVEATDPFGNIGMDSSNDELTIIGLFINFSQNTSAASESIPNASILVDLSSSSTEIITVDYSLSGTATLGADYTDLGSGTLTFAPGATQTSIDLSIINDMLDEPDQTIIITLSNPSNASIGPFNTHTYTILDDDVAPQLSITALSQSITEDDTGTITSGGIPISLSQASGKTITVDYALNVGASTATSGVDFSLVASPTGTITFAPGETVKQIDFGITGDDLFEIDEVFQFDLSNPTNATLNGAAQTGTVTILDDDPPPTLTLENSFILNEADGTAIYHIDLSSPSYQTITLDYVILPGTNSFQNEDWTTTAALSGTITFNPGDTSKTIEFSILDDNIFEDDETILLSFSNISPNVTHPYAPTVDRTIFINNDDALRFATVFSENGSIDSGFDPSSDQLILAIEDANGNAIADNGDELVFGLFPTTVNDVPFGPGSNTTAPTLLSATLSDNSVSSIFHANYEGFSTLISPTQSIQYTVNSTTAAESLRVFEDSTLPVNLVDYQSGGSSADSLSYASVNGLGLASTNSNATALIDNKFLEYDHHLLAIAYGENQVTAPGYHPLSDLAYVRLFDANLDGVVSVGDVIHINKLPSDLVSFNTTNETVEDYFFVTNVNSSTSTLVNVDTDAFNMVLETQTSTNTLGTIVTEQLIFTSLAVPTNFIRIQDVTQNTTVIPLSDNYEYTTINPLSLSPASPSDLVIDTNDDQFLDILIF